MKGGARGSLGELLKSTSMFFSLFMTKNTRVSTVDGLSISLLRRRTRAEICDLQKCKCKKEMWLNGSITGLITSEIPGLLGKTWNPGSYSVDSKTCLHMCTYKQS